MRIMVTKTIRHIAYPALFILLYISMLPCAEAIDIPDDHVLYNSWVLPGRNLTMLGETIEFHGFKDTDDRMIIEATGERLTMGIGDEKETADFRFHVKESRFDLDMLDQVGRYDMPWYGKIPRGSISRIYSFHVRIELLRPILEFRRTINDVPNHGDLTEIEANIDEKFNVSLEILNHGMDDTDFLHKETIPEGSKIIINSTRGVSVEKRDGYIEITGNTEDEPAVNYTIVPGGDMDFSFDSEAQITHGRRNFTYKERNKTSLSIDSGVDMMLGFYNGAIFRNRDRSASVGEEIMIGGFIENERDEPIDGKIRIDFPGGESEVSFKEDGRRYLDEVFSEETWIENNTKHKRVFKAAFMQTGEYRFDVTLEAETKHGKISMNDSLILDVRFDKPRPKAVFNSSGMNETIEMTIFLESDEARDVDEILVDIILSEDGYREEFSYRYNEIRLNERFLLNSISRHIMNSSNFNVEIKGHIITPYGELFSFMDNISIGDGHTRNYRNERSEIMHMNNLDERYENVDAFARPGRRDGMMVNIVGFVTGSGGGRHSPIVSAVVLFMIILTIQIMIFKKRKRN